LAVTGPKTGHFKHEAAAVAREGIFAIGVFPIFPDT
jgi:hypothetical protein